MYIEELRFLHPNKITGGFVHPGGVTLSLWETLASVLLSFVIAYLDDTIAL